MNNSFLGVGWKFPIDVDSVTGRIRTVSGDDDVMESIGIILKTCHGERVMRSTFGADINQFVFDSMNDSRIHLLQREIIKAITDWEARVQDVEVDIKTDDADSSRLLCHVSYRVRRTNNLFNQVYPFYINEGIKPE